MRHGPVQFRSTVVKPYYSEEGSQSNAPENTTGIKPESATPKDTLNAKPETKVPILRRGSRKRIPKVRDIWLTAKEEADYALCLKLRAEGKIVAPGKPFEKSDEKEIEGLINSGVFQFEEYHPKKHGGTRIFKSRLVREIKGKATDNPYEKSRMVIQGYNDPDKELILTQSPTI